MKISEATYNQLNELLMLSFDCNARADNLAYNIDYSRYPNINEIYHHGFAHKFPQLADIISDLMIQLNARPVIKSWLIFLMTIIKWRKNIVRLFVKQ